MAVTGPATNGTEVQRDPKRRERERRLDADHTGRLGHNPYRRTLEHAAHDVHHGRRQSGQVGRVSTHARGRWLPRYLICKTTCTWPVAGSGRFAATIR
jgi:hypothetical protein